VVQLGKGRSAEAAAAFTRAQGWAPADDAVCRRIADAYGALERHEEAERMYQRAIDLRPGYWESYNYKGHFMYRRGRLDEAKELFAEVVRLRPESDLGYSNLAGVHILAGEFALARPLLEKALRIKSGAPAHNHLGFVFYALGDYAKAAEQFQAAIDAGARRVSVYGNLGDAYRQLGETERAQDAYTEAIELAQTRLSVNAADAELRGAVSMCMAGAGRCPEAVHEAARAISDGEGNPIPHYYAAVAFSICGERPRALESALAAVRGGIVADVRTHPDLESLLDEPELARLLQ
jgi:tetratricopeptide (TPR) repeat protein